jgi:hypothetical protein
MSRGLAASPPSAGKSLGGLQHWESTVVYADTPEAHALLRRLKAAGLSRYEPNKQT